MDARREIGWSSEHTETRIRREHDTASHAQTCITCGGNGWLFDSTPGGLVRTTCDACLGIGTWWPVGEES